MQTKQKQNRSKHRLQNILKNRLALSTVVTTLIILVISVLLAGVVTYFAINVTSTRVQEESLHLIKPHVWYDGENQVSQAAIIIINTGGRDVVVDKLTVRGQEASWSSHVFYALTSISVSQDLHYISDVGVDDTPITGEESIKLVSASHDLTLRSGQTLIIYLTNPDSISVNDIGLTVSITVYTSQAMYHKETNVQGANSVQPQEPAPTDAPEPEGEAVTLSGMQIWYDTLSDKAQFGIVIQNTGGVEVIISSISCSTAWGRDYVYIGTFAAPQLQYISDLAVGSTTPLGAGTTFSGIAAWPTDCTIQPGESMILYVRDASGITESDVGQSVQVSITMLSENVYTQSATVTELI